MPQMPEQRSPEPCACTRCERLGRVTIIPAGAPHWALLDDAAALDAPPRIILCDACRRFVRHAATHAR